MTIVDKLNQIEEETNELTLQATQLATRKNMLEALLECEVHGHEWAFGDVIGNLRVIQWIDVLCKRCGCFVTASAEQGAAFPVKYENRGGIGTPLEELIGSEEDIE